MTCRCENDRDCVKTQEERNCAINFQALTKVRQRLTEDARSFHTVWTGYARTRTPLLFLGRRRCETLLPFSLKWPPNIATTFHARRPQPSCWVLTGTFPFRVTVRYPRRWRERFPTPPSPPRFAAEIGVCHRAHPRSARSSNY